jgi:hypothetical protein
MGISGEKVNEATGSWLPLAVAPFLIIIRPMATMTRIPITTK